ncbi:MAG: twin-arginine translocase TatA/TatE family subunit [Coriobacteriia bacterium]|nr:twin-arginine translocase TatA/TatE family subunit [Coriobacteriia bacterium]
MFGIGGAEIAIIAVFALLIFGPDKIPQIMQTLRKAVEMYTDARTQVTEVVNTQIISPEDREMLKDPLGLKGMKSSVDSLLTPERTSLYQQKPNAAPVAANSEAAEQVTSTGRDTIAGSIWASLTQDAPESAAADDAAAVSDCAQSAADEGR